MAELVRDWRVYVGQTLTAGEIRKLAFESGTRDCQLPNEGFDTEISDAVANLFTSQFDRLPSFRWLACLKFIDPDVQNNIRF